MNLILEVFKDLLREVGYFLRQNVRYFADILEFVLPYIMLWVGMKHGYLWKEMVMLPILVFIFVYVIKGIADKLGTGNKIPPIPNERFTQVDDDGEVSIENNRIQELLLYVADLEDWLERKGVL